MKEIIFPTHISDNVQQAAIDILCYAAYLYRKTDIFDSVIFDNLTKWEYEQLIEYMKDIEDNLRMKED